MLSTVEELELAKLYCLCINLAFQILSFCFSCTKLFFQRSTHIPLRVHDLLYSWSRKWRGNRSKSIKVVASKV
uniref:Uncharacterized protein n=1 Tax=Arundo donax TaxID=35708 RepID=A0A0A9CJ57_ARUDO